MQDESQFVLVFAISTLIIVLILILVILFVVAYQKRIATQQNQIDKADKEHQKALLQATLEVQERERKRIASDLHDDIGSLLSALKLNVSFLEESEQNDQQKRFLILTREKLESGIDQVRRISHDIYPPTLQKLGLWQALNDLIEIIQKSKQVKVTFVNEIPQLRLSSQTELAVYRVVQELITNSLRHSAAQAIHLKAFSNGGKIQLNYSDNGVGMPKNDFQKGLGFMNIRSRIEAISGTISFTSEAGKGFEANIIFNTEHGNTKN